MCFIHDLLLFRVSGNYTAFFLICHWHEHTHRHPESGILNEVKNLLFPFCYSRLFPSVILDIFNRGSRVVVFCRDRPPCLSKGFGAPPVPTFVIGDPVSFLLSFFVFLPAPSHGATSWRLRARLRPSPEI